DGISPNALIFDAHGNLYGTTSSGGPICPAPNGYSCGTVFELSPGEGGSWTETVLFSFNEDTATGNTTGANPFGLIFDSHGNLYGTTYYGGSGSSGSTGYGTVFELSPRHGGGWTEKVLH